MLHELTVRAPSGIPMGNHHHYHSGYALSNDEILSGRKACFSCLISQIAAVGGGFISEARDVAMDSEVRLHAHVCVYSWVCVAILVMFVSAHEYVHVYMNEFMCLCDVRSYRTYRFRLISIYPS